MDEFLMRTLKRIIKYHEDKELELLLKPLVKKWAKEFINEKYKEGVKYYIELGDKLFTRGLIEMNSADSAQSNFANRIVSMQSLNNVNGYASVVMRPNKEVDRVKEVDTNNRRDSIDIVMKKKEENKPSVVGLDLETLNDKCVKVLKEAKEVNQTGKGVEKCLKKLVKLRSLIEATLESQKDIDVSKKEWFQSVESKMAKVIERFNELSNEANDDDDESENDESDSDSEIHQIAVVKKNSKKHIKEKEKEEEDGEEEEEERLRKKSLSHKHKHSKNEDEEETRENRSRKHSTKHLKEKDEEEEEEEEEEAEDHEKQNRKHSNRHLKKEEEVEEEQQHQHSPTKSEKEKEKEKKHKHHHHKEHNKKEEENEENEENEKQSQLPPPPETLRIVTSPPPLNQSNQQRQRTASLPSPSYNSSSKLSPNRNNNNINNNNHQRNIELTKSISDATMLAHEMNLSGRQLSKSTSHLASKTSGKPPLSPASLKRKDMQELISPQRARNTSIPQQRQFSPNNPFLNPEIVNNTRHQRSNSDQIFNSISGITNPFLKPPPPPAPKIPNFNNPLKVYLDTPSGKLEPIEERDSNWDIGNNDLDIKDILQKKDNDNDSTNPFLGSTTPKKESLSSRHITGKNPFESPIIPEEISDQPQILPQQSTPSAAATVNPFLKLQKESSDSSITKNPFEGLSNANPFNNNDNNSRVRSNSMPVNTSSTNLFSNPYFMNQTTTFNNSSTSNILNQKQPQEAVNDSEGRRRFSTNPFDMVDDEDVIKAANEDFSPPENNEKEPAIPTQEKIEEKVEEKVEEKTESNSDLFASMFNSNPESEEKQEEEKPESNSDLFASMFNSVESKPNTIEEQTKTSEIESPKKPSVNEKFISSMLDTIPNNIQMNNNDNNSNENES